MKTLKLISTFVALVACGCGTMKYHKEVVKVDGTKEIVDFRGSQGWSKTTFNGLTIDGVSKTTSQALKINGFSNSPDSESITASGSALGELIGAAAKTAAKP